MQKTRLINLIFIGALMLILIVGLAFTLIAPNEIAGDENRYAEKISDFSFKAYFDGDFQNSIELATADQLPFSTVAKDGYNNAFSSYTMGMLNKLVLSKQSDDKHGSDEQTELEPSTQSAITTPSAVISEVDTTKAAIETQSAIVATTAALEDENQPKQETKPVDTSKSTDRYISVGSGLYLYRGYVVQGVASLSLNKDRITSMTDSFNTLIDNYPDIDFYCFYVEKESDYHLVEGYHSGVYEYLQKYLKVVPSHLSRLEVNNFEDFSNWFYKTDHHWAYKGSYEGYKRILAMLKPGETPLSPIDELKIGHTSGSLTKTSATANLTDDFYAYEFPYPAMDITVAKKTDDYGDQATYIANARAGKDNQKLSYGGFYGGDAGEIVFHNPSGSGTLLIFGNSYDNAVLKLIASHYEWTYSIDMRNYARDMGKKFDFSAYVEAHNIDTVLHIANTNYFLQAAYKITD